MDFAKVSVEIRQQLGKGPARRARSSGKLPAVLYGHKIAPLSLVLDPVELTHALDKERKRNTVFTLDLKSASKSEAVMAMIREVQIDPMSRRPVHVDFIRVSLDEVVRVTIPVLLLGIPVGVTDGGNLHQSYRNLPITAKPADIPTKIEMDVAALKIGDALHASDLKLPPGVKVMLDPKEALASVVAPRAEKVEEGTIQVVLTGGLSAAPWVRNLPGVDAIDPELTLKGLAILWAVASGSPVPGQTTAGWSGSAAGSIHIISEKAP